MSESNGKAALVIGASSGIGRETVVLLARAGWNVAAAARRYVALESLAAQLQKEGHTIEIAAADAAKASDMQVVTAGTLARFGRVDLMVYAAGTNSPDRSMARLNPERWDAMIAANLNGAYYICDAVLPAMRKAGGGQLVFITSVSALVPDVSGAAYQASKRGLHGLAAAIRVEEKENGIRTCLICPGLVDTEILDKRPVKPPPEVRAKALQPADVAEAVVFVAGLPPRVAIPEMQIVPAVL